MKALKWEYFKKSLYFFFFILFLFWSTNYVCLKKKKMNLFSSFSRHVNYYYYHLFSLFHFLFLFGLEPVEQKALWVYVDMLLAVPNPIQDQVHHSIHTCMPAYGRTIYKWRTHRLSCFRFLFPRNSKLKTQDKAKQEEYHKS